MSDDVKIVGFDFHGVSEKYPEVFKPLMQLLRAVGAEVWIISGPPLKQLLLEVTSAGYFAGTHFDNLISVVDYLKSVGTEMWENDKGTWEAEEVVWWESKAKICKIFRVDVLVDDTYKYYECFKKECPDVKFIHLMDCNFKDMLNGVVGLVGKSEEV